MLKLICDICGREIKKDEKHYSLILHDNAKDFRYREKFDICEECYKEIKKEVESK